MTSKQQKEEKEKGKEDLQSGAYERTQQNRGSAASISTLTPLVQAAGRAGGRAANECCS